MHKTSVANLLAHIFTKELDLQISSWVYEVLNRFVDELGNLKR